MWGSKTRAAAAMLAVLAGSQLGHALVSYARFGPGGAARQTAGVHAYLPALAGGLSAVIGTMLMTSLLLIAAARSLGPAPAGTRRRATLRLFDLLPVVFTAQLVVFIGQETAEAAAAGGPLPSVLQLLFWGALGQLPAALIASAVVAWLLTRLETAWTTIVAGVAAVLGEPEAPAPAATGRPRRTPSSTLESAFPAAFRKRGPPALPDRAAA